MNKQYVQLTLNEAADVYKCTDDVDIDNVLMYWQQAKSKWVPMGTGYG